MAERRSSDSAVLPSYVLPAGTLEYGASFGNAHCWLTTRGTGSIQELFSTDIARTVAGTVAVRYASMAFPVAQGSAEHLPGQQPRGVGLPVVEPGEIELHPGYQRRRFTLAGDIRVRETVFVPLTGDDDPPVACYHIELENGAAVARTLSLFAYARLGGTVRPDVLARYDRERRAVVAADRENARWVRVFGCTDPVQRFETTHDFGRLVDMLHVAPLADTATASGDILGALQLDLALAPGERRRVAFVLAFSPTGEEDAIAVHSRSLDVDAALDATIERLTRCSTISRVLTPNRTVNTATLWAKVNMLRVMARYPTGPAFTNDPSNSSAVVARDAAWFVYGNDHLLPGFSRALLDTFAALQYEDGKIAEYYHAVTGARDDYNLNINDDTPLFILAVNHHYRATGDLQWLRGIYPAVARAARYIVAQSDDRGLICCSARDPRGNLWAICGWRNVIADYTLNGAVTEINAECVAALRAAAHLTRNLGLDDAESAAFFDASTALQEAMDRHLLNPGNGLYYLNIDADGVAHTDVTADLVFPVIFRACSEAVGFHIIRRLNYPDFWTSAGLRTVSCNDPLYDPSRFYGLLGGVWPGLSWWYAFAAARYHPEIMVQALTASFEHYAADPRTNNTVPGQFSEWFDGEGLTNRGMRLSPWEPPRFLWAAVEGICGVVLQPGRPKIQPLVPAGWRWVGLRNLPYHGGALSYFAVREAQDGAFRIYATGPVEAEHEVEVFDEDVSDLVRVLNPDVGHIALRRPDRTIVLFGHAGDGTALVPIDLAALLETERTYRARYYDSEAYSWRDGEAMAGAALSAATITLDAHGFRLLLLEPAG